MSWPIRKALTVVAAVALPCLPLAAVCTTAQASGPVPILISDATDPSEPSPPILRDTPQPILQSASRAILQEPAAPILQPAEVLPAPNPQAAPNTPVKPQNNLLPEETPIGKIGTNIVAKGDLFPANIAADQFGKETDPFVPRPWMEQVYHWDAPALCYRPLRYEQVNLERYGYSRFPHLQPVISAGHFLGATLALPYSITARPSHECIYPLGHYRPGSPVPYQAHWAEWNLKAAAVQGAAVTGLIFAIP